MKCFHNAWKPISYQKTSISVFKNILLKRSLIQHNSFWRPLITHTMLFKSFFVFLRTKPFIIKMRYNLLVNFIMNPRPRTLSTFISLTKKFRANPINEYFMFTKKNLFISKQQMRYFLYKLNNKSKKKFFFNLFKYKLFQYTTAPKLKIIHNTINSHFLNIDFRTNLLNIKLKRSFPNIHTVSTYNWKIIN